MTKLKKLLALLLVAAMIVGPLAACSSDDDEETEAPETEDTEAPEEEDEEEDDDEEPEAEEPDDGVLVIMSYGTFEEKWNPFLAESAYDMDVLEQIFVTILARNADNEMESHGGDIVADEQDDGTVIYTVTVNEGMYYTDGTEVTIDDFIYGLYVRADPSYTGPAAAVNMDIEGVKEYYYDDPDYSEAIAQIEAEADKYLPENISFEDFLIYAEATALAGEWDGDPSSELDEDYTWIDYIVDSGYEAQLAEIDETDPDEVFEVLALVEYDEYVEDYDAYTWFLDQDKLDYAMGNLESGVSVEEISGIQKVDDYTCTVTYTQVNIYADRDLGDKEGCGMLAPAHYYGDFEKGDVSAVLANMEPVGSGPYVWQGFSDNIVTCVANPDYFEGVPKTGTVRWQYIPINDQVTALVSGQVDIGEPTASNDNVAELEAGGIEMDLVDVAGYGYMGLNHDNLSQEVRKGMLCLMNRAPAVEAYFGDLAVVIERPMSTVVSEYPQDAEQYYPYDPDEALAYFEAGGYTQQDGVLVDADGNQLVVNVYVGGEGEGAHPAYAMLVQAAEHMADLGGELQIQDVSFNVLQAAMNDGTADMFCLAWSEVDTCDKTAQFHTEGGQNRFNVSDSRMDALLEEIMVTVDYDERCALVEEMLDLAMDLCIEYPLYQRQNMFAYNPTTLNMDTIPEATSFYDYKRVLWQVELA